MILFMSLCLGVSHQNAELIERAAAKYHIPITLFAAVLYQESFFDAKAVNATAPVKSYGMGQLTKNTAWDMCRLKFEEIFDAEKNINCSAKVLANKLDRYHGNPIDALSAYNAGTSTPKNGAYVSDVFDKAIILERKATCDTNLKSRKNKQMSYSVH